jgi:hypothetical protein
MVWMTGAQKREQEFRDTSESTYTRILWWNIGQAILLVLAAYYQASSLRKFITKKGMKNP